MLLLAATLFLVTGRSHLRSFCPVASTLVPSPPIGCLTGRRCALQPRGVRTEQAASRLSLPPRCHSSSCAASTRDCGKPTTPAAGSQLSFSWRPTATTQLPPAPRNAVTVTQVQAATPAARALAPSQPGCETACDSAAGRGTGSRVHVQQKWYHFPIRTAQNLERKLPRRWKLHK